MTDSVKKYEKYKFINSYRIDPSEKLDFEKRPETEDHTDVRMRTRPWLGQKQRTWTGELPQNRDRRSPADNRTCSTRVNALEAGENDLRVKVS